MRKSHLIPNFIMVVTGCLVALSVWHMGIWVWERFGWVSLALLVGLWLLLNLAYLFKHWLDGRRGLGQWPEPHGLYYEEWLKLPESADDYYDWLATRMENREPWRTWAKLDRFNRGVT